MPNRRPVDKTDPDLQAAAVRQQQHADLQAAAAAEAARHAHARIDDLTRRTIELHAEIRRRDRELDKLRAELDQARQEVAGEPDQDPGKHRGDGGNA